MAKTKRQLEKEVKRSNISVKTLEENTLKRASQILSKEISNGNISVAYGFVGALINDMADVQSQKEASRRAEHERLRKGLKNIGQLAGIPL